MYRFLDANTAESADLQELATSIAQAKAAKEYHVVTLILEKDQPQLDKLHRECHDIAAAISTFAYLIKLQEKTLDPNDSYTPLKLQQMTRQLQCLQAFKKDFIDRLNTAANTSPT